MNCKKVFRIMLKAKRKKAELVDISTKFRLQWSN